MASTGVKNTSPTTIFIWIVPRTGSTALAKCMSFVDDTRVWMEPYVSCFFNETVYNPEYRRGDPHMDKTKAMFAEFEGSEKMKAIRKEMESQIRASSNIIDQKDISYQWVKSQLETSDPGKRFVVVKDLSFGIDGHLEYLPAIPNCRHVFLIRHPREVYFSFKELASMRLGDGKPRPWDECHVANDLANIPVPNLFQIHSRLWKLLRGDAEFEPVVMDTFDFTSQPEVVLPKFFDKLGVPFHQRYLSWDGGDKVITKTWKGTGDRILMEPKGIVYYRAVNSSRFEPPRQPRGTPSNPDLWATPELEEYIEGAMPFYEEMYAHRIH